MKRALNTFIVILFMFLITGCGKLDESWNGVYTNGTEYSVLIYTKDNKTASIAVMQKSETYTCFNVEYSDYLSVSDTVLTTIVGEPIKIVKDGMKIVVTLESEDKGMWADIEGEYTKVKNAKSFNRNQF